MTHSLQVINGDINVVGSHMGVLEGFQKLQQDLQIWILYTYGSDPNHPTFGSVLDSMVGSAITNNTTQAIASEVMRVLVNYQTLQLADFQANPSNFTQDELLASIDNVAVTQNYSTISVTITFTTSAGTQTSFNTGLSTGMVGQ